jgi:hypothetical protein
MNTMLATHGPLLLSILGLIFFILAAGVSLTKSKEDDKTLLEALNSPLAKKLASGGAVALAGGLAAALLGGCGMSAIDVTRTTIAGGALAVVSVDPILVDQYADAESAYEAGTLTKDSYEAKLRRLDRAERALRSFSSALNAVDLALDAYEDGRECGIAPALEGAVASASEVVASLRAAGLNVPPLVTSIVEMATVFLDAPECDPDNETAEALRDLIATARTDGLVPL